MTAPLLTPDSRRAYRAWLAQNPLRLWRQAHDPAVSVTEAAAALGCNTSMVRFLESGSSRPGKRTMPILQAKISPTMAAEWDDWWAVRPAGVTEKETQE